MGILSKLFGRPKENTDQQQPERKDTQTGALSKPSQLSKSLQPQNAISRLIELSAHPELRNLLWWGDGPYKNYIPAKSVEHVNVDGLVLEISLTGMQEPSLLSVQAPVKTDVNPANVERLPYYPEYSRLSPEQKGVYWQFLRNPYAGSFEIGYVFILYYGLERHLLKGDYENAFQVILKLRDVYNNGSFQSYSGCALIIACLMHGRIDLLNDFFASLDKGYELKFPANLYLLGKYGLGIPLYAQDIMRMAKDFEFTNLNYIKKLPDLFEKLLQEQMQSRYGLAQLDISSLVGASDMKKAYKVDFPAFANVSIERKTIPVPQIFDVFKFKKAVNDLLESTHNAVKANVVQQRKDGRLPTAKEEANSTPKKILTFDTDMESSLLNQYHIAGNDPVAKHFSMIALQDFYYKYRDLNDQYLAACIRFCEEDLSSLEQFSAAWRTQNLNTPVRIPAFQRMAIIYEKSKAHAKGIAICEQAISFYQSNGMVDLANGFSERKAKMQFAMQKVKATE